MAATLKYLFTVLYRDGSTYQQAEDDISVIDPKRSCFTDATAVIKDGKFVLDEKGEPVKRMQDIHRFLLIENTGSANPLSYMVDLETGHFEVGFDVNGRPTVAPFRLHSREIQYQNRKLVFWRNHKQHISVSLGSVHPQITGHEVAYCLGWEAHTHTGQNVQFVMEID